MSEVDVITEIVIDRPRSQVAPYTADPDNAPVWYENIRTVGWETPKPLSVGSRLKFSAHFLGRQLDYIYEVTELIPTERLVMSTSEGPFPMETTYSWSDADVGGTRVILCNRGTAFWPFLSRSMPPRRIR